jgi:CRP-like cAMP-binding protein
MSVVAEKTGVAPPAPQTRNHLLATLPRSEYLQVRPHLTTVQLESRLVLNEPGRPIDAVYFPLDVVISVVAGGDAGMAVEVASVGCEGMVGLPVLFGTDRSTNRVLVQITGTAERMDAAELRRAATRHAQLRRLLHLYAQGFVTQISQSTACNRLHSAEQRLARWLLICRDRLGCDELPITHRTMSLMLGVRRATVTEAAGALQREGLIRYRRGMVSLVDRPRLETTSCECYGIVRREFDRLLGVRVG